MPETSSFTSDLDIKQRDWQFKVFYKRKRDSKLCFSEDWPIFLSEITSGKGDLIFWTNKSELHQGARCLNKLFSTRPQACLLSEPQPQSLSADQTCSDEFFFKDRETLCSWVFFISNTYTGNQALQCFNRPVLLQIATTRALETQRKKNHLILWDWMEWLDHVWY